MLKKFKRDLSVAKKMYFLADDIRFEQLGVFPFLIVLRRLNGYRKLSHNDWQEMVD